MTLLPDAATAAIRAHAPTQPCLRPTCLPRPGCRRTALVLARRPLFPVRAGQGSNPEVAGGRNHPQQGGTGSTAATSGASSYSGSSNEGAGGVRHTLELLDQLLGVEILTSTQESQETQMPASPPPSPRQSQVARRAAVQQQRLQRQQQLRPPEEPPLIFYDPQEEAGWKHTTRCILVGVVGAVAALAAAALLVMAATLGRQGVPVGRWADLVALKEGECLFTQQHAVCRKESTGTQHKAWRAVGEGERAAPPSR